ncbi:vancomycin permeability regulator SanA [Actinoplanes abujensis]|uniref:Vancomycin permeability regulator SanA n=2 Tax=Paractinoplanes abujensis TaxID=882441 RepID=A0A7W7D3Z2_9ACTN|nr:vancomycin permeability regulator SanA [Actinoplanes abujensis]
MRIMRGRWVRRGLTAGALVVALGVLASAGGELWTRGSARGHVYSEAGVPAAPVAIVLGAQVYDDGSPSPFLAARLDIAKRLLDAGKVRAILVSGDHSRWEYDEPGSSEVYLVARGVPASRIALDYAGFDTYDSCARAKRIFGVGEAIVVTQTYHIDRAVALCRTLGIEATGVGDDSVRVYSEPWRNSVVRERGAVLKAVADVVTRRDPVFLGRQETTVQEALAG